MDYNFHTHTARCGHATGSDEAYVRAAIAGGITDMGFSDHVPFVFPDGRQRTYCVQMEEAAEYIASVRALREKYARDISLHVGFEMEYYPQYFDAMLAGARQLGAEYLILGAHYLPSDVFHFHTQMPHRGEKTLVEYVDTVIEAIGRGVFTYVAHPDVYCFIGGDEIYRREMRRLCEAARAADMPLEINFLGIREGRAYPTELFWQIAGEVGAPVTFGFDAHDPESAADRASLPTAKALVEKYHLNYIGKPKLHTI